MILFSLFVSFWPCWVFVAVQAFFFFSPLVAESRVHSSSAQASLCGGLLQNVVSRVGGLQQLQCVGSVTASPGLWSTGAVVVAHGLRCSAAYGILPDQGSSPCSLHWQADFLPLSQQGSPNHSFKVFYL